MDLTKEEALEAFANVSGFMEWASDETHLARQAMIALGNYPGFVKRYKELDAKMQKIEHELSELAKELRKHAKEIKNNPNPERKEEKANG